MCAGIWFCSTEFSKLKDKPGSDVSIVEVGFHTDLQVYLQLRQTWIIACKRSFGHLMLLWRRTGLESEPLSLHQELMIDCLRLRLSYSAKSVCVLVL